MWKHGLGKRTVALSPSFWCRHTGELSFCRLLAVNHVIQFPRQLSFKGGERSDGGPCETVGRRAFSASGRCAQVS
jgi:hypothetical protein